MRTRCGTILVAAVALVVGGAAGSLASRACWNSENEEVRKAANSDEARPSAAADSGHRRKPDAVAEEPRAPEVAKPAAKPVQMKQAVAQEKGDDTFTRYLDMFKNDPGALAAEFHKEVESDRAHHANLRQEAIAKLNLNAAQAAVFEKGLDDLVATMTQLSQERVDLVLSGEVDMDKANREGDRFGGQDGLPLCYPRLSETIKSVRENAIQETAESLYEQLALDGVSGADAQNIILNAAWKEAASYECLEPFLAIYDKVYKSIDLSGYLPRDGNRHGTFTFGWRERGRR